MFNVLSGLQEGSHSVTVVSRAANTAQGPWVKGAVVITSGGKLTQLDKTANANAQSFRSAEFVFEDITGNSSTMYTTIYGSFEFETDWVDTTGLAADDYLTVVAGKMAKAAAGDLTNGLLVAKVISVASGIVKARTI